MRKILTFIFEAAMAGLAFAFVLMLVFRPDTFERRPVVEVKETAQPAVTDNAGAPASYAKAVQAAAPAVVNIYSTKMVAQRPHPFLDEPFFRRFFDEDLGTPRRRMQSSLGSGVIISAQGYILTNNHVVEGADEILIALSDERTAPAQVVGTDPPSDLAVLKVKLDELPTITLGQSQNLQVGDVALAIGNPFGVGQTVTQGIISATGRNQLGISPFTSFIQTDAAINPGSSGGALINTAGELIGINTAIYSRSGGSQGVGFAIPTSLAKRVMQQIIEQGRVIRGWLGIRAQDITPSLAESFGLQSPQAFAVAGVLSGSPADQAGLRPGDVITHIDGEPAEDAHSAMTRITQYPPGTEVVLRIVRQGEATELTVEIGQRPEES